MYRVPTTSRPAKYYQQPTASYQQPTSSYPSQYMYKDYKMPVPSRAHAMTIQRNPRLDRDQSAWQGSYTPSDYIF